MNRSRTARRRSRWQSAAAGTSCRSRLQFAPADSGTPQAPVIYQAYRQERPILSGGRRIEGWKVDAQGRWHASLPDVKSGVWTFAQLFVNDQRRSRPRLPKQGYYHVAEKIPPSPAAHDRGFDGFKFSGDDLRADWANLGDVEVLGFPPVDGLAAANCRGQSGRARRPLHGPHAGTERLGLVSQGQSLPGGKRPRGPQRAGPVVPRSLPGRVDLSSAAGRKAGNRDGHRPPLAPARHSRRATRRRGSGSSTWFFAG